MLIGIILSFSYVALRLLFGLATMVDPSFRRRLEEADLSFAVRSKAGPSAGLFRLQKGKLRYLPRCEGPADFTVTWNGWGDAYGWGKRLRLHTAEFLNRGMITLEGDLSCVIAFFMFLGEALGSLRRRNPAPVRRAELSEEEP